MLITEGFFSLRETEDMMLAVPFPSIPNYLCRCNGTGCPPFCHSREQREHPDLPRLHSPNIMCLQEQHKAT